MIKLSDNGARERVLKILILNLKEIKVQDRQMFGMSSPGGGSSK